MTAAAGLSQQRSNSLPDLKASPSDDRAEQKSSEDRAAQLKGYLPYLPRRSYIYGAGFATCRRNEVLKNMERYRDAGDLPRLWAGIRRAKLDAHLDDSPTVNEMHRVLATATKQKTICENVARRLSKSGLT